jgi:hypothetical protein
VEGDRIKVIMADGRGIWGPFVMPGSTGMPRAKILPLPISTIPGKPMPKPVKADFPLPSVPINKIRKRK